MDSKYLKDLQQVLEAEAALARGGVDLLADPEYRALRERFIDGEMTIEEFVGRVEGLAEIRPDVDDAGGGADEADDAEAAGGDDAEDLEDLEDPDDLEDLRVFNDIRHRDGPDDAGPSTEDEPGR